ncbi:MAG: phosphoenolpyruvate--protein phosphotransferase [Solirubrobacteraceae bacterium]
MPSNFRPGALMVGIVVVSHSEPLAEGVVRLAREMGGEDLALEAAGGMDEPGVLGTDADRVRAAIERAMSPDGVLVLMDLGSALMSTEFAIEMLAGASGEVRMSEAPLVEGAVAAAVAARGGATLEEVAVEARGALAMKASQLGVSVEEPVGVDVSGAAPDATATLAVRNKIGLHARPAARVIEAVRDLDADVRIAKAGAGRAPASAKSLTAVVSLGARMGDELEVSATGPDAHAAIAALMALADEGFGDGVDAVVVQAPPAAFSGPPVAGDLLSGVPASPGVVLGNVWRLDGASAAPPRDRPVDDPAAERARLDDALAEAATAIGADRELIAGRAGQAEAEIFDAHLALLADEALLGPARSAIERGASAERAWHDAAVAVAGQYRALSDPLLAERATDVLDVGARVVGLLSGASAETVAQAGIVIADELTPAQAARLDPSLVTGIATAGGSTTAHAAILARALGLPAVVGLGSGLLAIADGTTVLLDGRAGTVLMDPSPEVQRDAWTRRERDERRRAAARKRAHEPGALRDGTRIEVFANLGAVGEAPRAVELGAEGVGLLRTEFLFLDRATLPDEDEQAETLRGIAVDLGGRPLVVRTLDAGADKPLPALPMPAEANPFLGVRGIRLALAREDVLETQLRAILRVATQHPVKVMLPMVATADEIEATRAVLARAREATGVATEFELGIMVEVPAAALTANVLAEQVDFFSVGTNDLTQYTMAAERGDPRLAGLLDGTQPAVLRLIKETVAAAAAHGCWVGVCGELAGDPEAAVLLAGLGVTELSMAPPLIAEVKAALRQVSLSDARAAADSALGVRDAKAARSLASSLLRE